MKKIIEPKIPGQRMDSWSNLATLLGTSADKRTHARANWEMHPPEFYEQLYAGGGIPSRIVDLIPEEALRHWVDWLNVEKEDIEKVINPLCEELDVRGALLKSWKWGRAYGGAVCHIVTDTRDPSSPLQVGEKVIGLRDLSRWDLRILTTDVEFDFGSPNWGMPRIYYLNVQMGSQFKGYPIHWTRMLRFDGQLVPRRTYIRNNYWHDSILNRPYNAIRNYEISNDAAAACLQDFNVDVYGMKNLANLISAGKVDVVRNRIETINYAKSVIRAILIDTDQETYENKSRSLEGVAELLDKQSNRLVAETDIPHTKLLGESPDGSNATGNSTSQNWYNYIGTEQYNYLRPKLKRLCEVLFPEYPQIDFKFKSLRVLDDMENADLRLKVAQADDIYMTHNVIDPTEVAESRFSNDEYSIETKLDWEGRESGDLIPGGQMPGMEGNDPGEGIPGTGDKPPEGESTTSSTSGTGEKSLKGEPPPSEPEPGNDVRNPEGEDKNLKGKPKKKFPMANSKGDADVGNPTVEGRGVEGLFQGENNPGLAFYPKNQKLEVENPVPKVESFISQTMSEPMRDPRTDPHIKGPGIPNKPRTFLPTRGNGMTSPSGFDFEKDAGSAGVAREGSSKAVEGGSYYAYDSADKPEPTRAATIVVRDGDMILMGKRKDGRWALPGGHIEAKESAHQGGVRELDEETGLKAKKLKFLGSRLVEPEMGKSVAVHMYEHKHDGETKPTFKKDPDKEFDEFRWVNTKEKLPDEIEGNLAHPNNVALSHLGMIR